VTAGLGLGLVGVFLARRRDDRLRLAEEQLPAALDLLASALRAGLGVQAALEAAARETPPPLGDELRRLLGEIRLGTPFAQAADALTERLPGREVRALVVALEVQRETGGPLAGVLETVAETLRARARLRGQVQALTAEVRLSALVLGLLPAALLVVLWLLSPGYIRPFVEAPAGQLLLLGAAGLQGLGFLLMRRLGEIDV
jgi:tight adherence protein B